MYFLVISNDQQCRTLVVRNLLVRGFMAAGFASIPESSSLLERIKPLCLIVYEYPFLTDQTLAAARSHHHLEDVPVVAISDEPPSKGWLEEWTIDRYIKNPFRISDLLEALSPWLNRDIKNLNGIRSA